MRGHNSQTFPHTEQTRALNEVKMKEELSWLSKHPRRRRDDEREQMSMESDVVWRSKGETSAKCYNLSVYELTVHHALTHSHSAIYMFPYTHGQPTNQPSNESATYGCHCKIRTKQG